MLIGEITSVRLGLLFVLLDHAIDLFVVPGSKFAKQTENSGRLKLRTDCTPTSNITAGSQDLHEIYASGLDSANAFADITHAILMYRSVVCPLELLAQAHRTAHPTPSYNGLFELLDPCIEAAHFIGDIDDGRVEANLQLVESIQHDRQPDPFFFVLVIVAQKYEQLDGETAAGKIWGQERVTDGRGNRRL